MDSPFDYIKRAIDRIFGVKFDDVSPMLRDPVTLVLIIIDFYNDDLKIGIDYQDRCHYDRHFCQSELDFRNLQRQDEEKKKRCRQKGILLITVPYTKAGNDVEWYIKNAIDSLRCSPLRTLSLRMIRLNKIDTSKIPKAILPELY